MEKLRLTPSQTVGPYFAYSLTARQYGYDFNSIVDANLIAENKEGQRIYIVGAVFDGEGKTVFDAMVELWQMDENGKYISKYPNIPVSQIPFKGFGREGTGTNENHEFRFCTIKPGSVDGLVPYINVMLCMRGSLHVLYTRIYFSDEDNSKDPLLNLVDVGRRHTLIAEKKIINNQIVYRFDIHMQGENETVFFDV